MAARSLAPPRRLPPRLRWALLLMAGLMLPVLWLLFGPRGVPVELVRKSWRFDIKVERLIEESGSNWCDLLPPGAREIERRRLADPSGERALPGDHCRYSLPAWRTLRLARAEGEAGAAPHWPSTPLSPLPPDALGAERLGERERFYEVELRARSTGKTWTCRLGLAQWQALPLGTRMRLQVDRQGTANCASMPAV